MNAIADFEVDQIVPVQLGNNFGQERANYFKGIVLNIQPNGNLIVDCGFIIAIGHQNDNHVYSTQGYSESDTLPEYIKRIVDPNFFMGAAEGKMLQAKTLSECIELIK